MAHDDDAEHEGSTRMTTTMWARTMIVTVMLIIR